MKLTVDHLEGLKVADQKGRITLGSKYAGKHFVVREETDGTSTLIPILVVPEREQPLTSKLLTETFTSLEKLGDNWDGNGSPAPSKALLTEAKEALALMHAGALARGLRWAEPHVGVNERGQITLEWWKDTRSLTIFIRSEDQIEYLKAWGINIETQMEDGELNRLADFVSLSRWLYEENTETR
jgi:biotin operon repressor